MDITTLGYAFLGGLLPALIWLYFLLKEDARHREPRTLIAFAFIAGMIAVPIALPLEQFAQSHMTGNFQVFTAWALIEEMLKYAVVAILILWRPVVNEAPDYVIFMITVALGFAAAENMLFLISPIMSGDIANSFFTGNVRFLGSSLLHVVASAAIGFSLAFSVKGSHIIRVIASGFGLILAIALHTAFNTLIINPGTSATLGAFFLVWIVAVIFFAAFEVLKYFQYCNSPNNTQPV